jgi:hypothetical protein
MKISLVLLFLGLASVLEAGKTTPYQRLGRILKVFSVIADKKNM